MKTIKKFWFNLWDNKDTPKIDKINGMMSILTCDSNIETQISTKLEFDILFEENLIKKRQINSKENRAIDFYFNPLTANNIKVNDFEVVE